MKFETVLIVGSGGREHAFMHAFAQEGIQQLATSANAGMEKLGQNLHLNPGNLKGIVTAAINHEVDLVVIGPEEPLIGGLADRLRSENIPVLGFGRQAARLEGSKAFAAGFTAEYGVLAPESFVTASLGGALHYARSREADSFVIKADGAAGGKGVILPETDREAEQVIGQMMSGKLFGEAGQRLVFQERLNGPEVSMFAVYDGKKAVILPLAQDHKRLKDNDEGPNTGGMGAYSPVPPSIVSEEQFSKMQQALENTMEGTQRRGIASPGILYLGFMLAEQYDGDPVLMEYNVRFGDPEAQVVLPLLKEAGENVSDLFYTAARGGLRGDKIRVAKQLENHGHALTVCLAAEGYPNEPRKGDVIYSVDRLFKDVTVYQGGTEHRPKEGNRTVTNGGRAVYVTGIGESLPEAAASSYAAIGEDAINFQGMQYRTDIGHLAIAASNSNR